MAIKAECFFNIEQQVADRAVIANNTHKIYGTGLAVREIIPDHMERILQNVSKLKIKRMFVKRKKSGLQFFFINPPFCVLVF